MSNGEPFLQPLASGRILYRAAVEYEQYLESGLRFCVAVFTLDLVSGLLFLEVT